MTILFVAKDFIPKLPDQFKCPICGAKIYIDEITEWDCDGMGRWYPADVHINCVTEPDYGEEDARERDEWNKQHWSMPYVDWLPLEKEVENWLMDNYRFDLYARTAEEELQALADWNAGRAKKVG